MTGRQTLLQMDVGAWGCLGCLSTAANLRPLTPSHHTRKGRYLGTSHRGWAIVFTPRLLFHFLSFHSSMPVTLLACTILTGHV